MVDIPFLFHDTEKFCRMQGECCKCAIFDVSARRKVLPHGSVLALYYDFVGGLAGFAHHDVADLGDGIAVKFLLIDCHRHAAVGHNNRSMSAPVGLCRRPE